MDPSPFLSVEDRLQFASFQQQLRELGDTGPFLAVVGADTATLADAIRAATIQLAGERVRVHAAPAPRLVELPSGVLHVVSGYEAPAISGFLRALTLHRDRLAERSLRLVLLLDATAYATFAATADLRNFVQFHHLFTDQETRARRDTEPLAAPEPHQAYHQAFAQLQAYLAGNPADKQGVLALVYRVVQLGVQAGDYATLEPLIDEGIELAEYLEAWETAASLRNTQGRMLQFTNRPEAARAAFERALGLDRQHGFAQGEAVVLFNLGLLELDLERYEAATEFLETGLALCPPDDIRLHVRYLAELAKATARLGHAEQALEWMRRARAVQQPLPVEIHLGFGDTLETLGYFREAIDSLGQLLDWIREIGNEPVESILCARLGELYRKTNDFGPAETYLRRALALQEKWDLPLRRASTLSNLALIVLRSGRDETALEYMQQALDLYTRHDRDRDRARLLGNIAAVWHERGEYARGMDYYTEAYALDLQTGWLEGQSYRLGNLGLLSLHLGQWEEARAYLDDGMELDRSAGLVEERHTKIHYRAMLHLAQGTLETARADAETALDYFTDRQALAEQAYVLRTLAAIHRAAGREAQANRAERKAAALEAAL